MLFRHPGLARVGGIEQAAGRQTDMFDRLKVSTEFRGEGLATLFGGVVAVFGAAILVAWLAGVFAPQQVGPTTVKTNAALCLLLSGAALVLAASTSSSNKRGWLVRAGALAVLLVGVLTLTENLSGLDLHIDRLLANASAGALNVGNTDRMRLPACVCFILIATALLILAADADRRLAASGSRAGDGRADGTNRGVLFVQGLALIVCMISLLSILGFLYGADELYAGARLTAGAWPTAVALFVLGLGLLFARPSEALMALVTAPDPGGASVRRLLIPALLLPVVLGWLRLEGEHAMLFDAAMGTALVMVTFTLVFAWVVYQSGRQTSRSAAAQAESERQFRIMGETVPYGVWLCGPDGGVRYCSQSFLELLNMTQEEQQQFGWTKRLVPEDVTPLMQDWSLCRETGTLWDHEHRIIDRAGEIHTILSRGLPVRDAEGRITCWVGVNLDITERKKRDEELRHAKEELEERVRERTAELAARARQLRALAGDLTRTEQRERLRIATVLHDHLQQLLVAIKYRVVSFGRGDSRSRQEASKEVLELLDESIAASRSLTAELSPPVLHEGGLDDALGWLARNMADKHGLSVELSLQAGDPPLAQDVKILLFESVRELLFNTVKHSGSPTAAVCSCVIEEELQLQVSDQGAGFDPKAVTPAGEAGGGFGLFSIRERLELIGGGLQINSSPGSGSRFLLTAPLRPATAVSAEPLAILPSQELDPIREGRPRTQGLKIRVMLADDHAVVRQGLELLLRKEPDIEVVAKAADGQEAVELAAKLLPDVILMDMNMPRLNGVEATRVLRADLPGIKIIGFSMFEEAERNQAMRDAGAADYLTKSSPAGTIVAAIRKAASAVNRPASG